MARVCVDSNYFEVNDQGQLTIVKGSLGYQETIQVFGGLTDLSFQIANYPLATWLFVECIGGGGGGAGMNASASGTHGGVGGGGSGGTYCASWLQAATLPAIVAVSAGDGGSGGVFDDGDDGEPSTFGSLVIAPGGIGASEVYGASTTTSMNPGAPQPGLGTGQIRRAGSPGMNAIMSNSVHKSGGNGGASGWPGPGGLGGLSNESGKLPQTFAGGGGGGAAAFGNNQPGGSGGAGLVRISIYN
ncbi:hypothetical protein SEA_XKCD426_30 [Streptomyces phage Xkcd426]|nr:hypothetical protein SEA_XKCD426_30 [Streptomyces phage Xkcd426]